MSAPHSQRKDTGYAEIDQMLDALTSGEQLDPDGVFVKVSRQACEEAAYEIRTLLKQRDTLRAKQSGPADSVTVPKAFLEAACCPNCSGVGWKAIMVEPGVMDQEQCQWCFERWQILGQPAATSERQG